ncbi:unnamed protein product [Somion occarium]|uniref:RhoGAP-domain-containing protein n=1 Tax=Somion occarium TaxID=3059160 RepID=A0ABP1E496_9APHY
MNLLIPQTPSRDRSLQTPAQYSSPTVLRTAASSSAMSPNPGAASAAAITAESLLNTHANAANPPLAALDAAVSDRNNFAAQNTQLWKLIEKQRTGYAQLMKELDRVRGERDVYRSKLNSLGENTDVLLKAHREKERREGSKEGSLRSATSHSHLRTNETSSLSANDPRSQMVRTHSDEVASRHRHRNTSQPSLSQSPGGRERQGSQSSLNVPSSLSSTSTYLNTSQASSTTNLAISPSSSSLSPLSTSSGPQVFLDNNPRKPSPLQLATPVRSASLNTPGGYSVVTPSVTPFSSAVPPPNTGDPLNTSGHTSRSAVPPLRTPQAFVTPSTPAQSAGIAVEPSLTKSRHHSSFPNPPTIQTPSSNVPPIVRSDDTSETQTNTNTLQPTSLIPSQLSNISVQDHLSPAMAAQELAAPSRPYALSRESRISLPEEAKRYYATMSESPVPSPRVTQGFLTPPNQSSTSLEKPPSEFPESPPPITVQDSTGTVKEVEHADAQSQRAIPNGRRSTEDNSEFLELEDGDSLYDSAGGSDRGVLSSTTTDPDDDPDDAADAHVPRAKGKKRAAAVEDFPLPPSTPPVIHPGGPEPLTTAQMQALAAAQRGQVQADSSGNTGTTGLTPGHTTPGQSVSSLQPPTTPVSPFTASLNDAQPTFRALPLLASDLPHTQVTVSHSSIRPNDRGKEVLSFTIVIDPGKGKETWKVEKLFSDVLTLDSRVRATLGKNVARKLVTLPEGKLWRDHAPAKVDQRKIALELYFKSLIALPVKNKDEIIAFFTSDMVRDASQPVSQAGYKEGYLTKRGKNFGGWKTRYFVLNGPSLEYYESRGGTHLGSITITGAQIGRQQKSVEKQQPDEDNDYRHAFLIIEAKKGPGGSNPRHVLCAQSDKERDSWVEELVRYVSGTYNEEDLAAIQNGGSMQTPSRTSTSSTPSSDLHVTPTRRPRKDEIAKGPAVPISQLPPDATNAKLFQSAPPPDALGSSSSPIKTSAQSSYVEHRLAGSETPISSSLPTSSPLAGTEDVDVLMAVSQRANSEMGHYPDLVDSRVDPARAGRGRASPEQRRKDKRRSMNPVKPAPIPEREPSPEKDDPHTPRVDAHGKVKISGPMNGTPIPAGYKFGKDVVVETTPTSDRREKAKSRTFWGFGRQHADKPAMPVHIPRAVFGVGLEESLDIAQIASLPAIVFRCIQYLEAKKADQEEGIYRLSGSSAVIKALKDRFNTEGDVDLLASDEYWDPHAIAGLLKTFLRELPASILTRDLHLRFLAVIDFVDAQERIAELSHLIASLPVANYTLLRALTAHLILIVQNANVNKMTMRNVGIVFSPTLGIPAGVFSLMLGEFKRVFNVDGLLEAEESTEAAGDDPEGVDMARRNSRHYSDAAADAMLGLSGRALNAAEEAQSDEGEELSILEESGTEETAENESVLESSAASSTANLVQQNGRLQVNGQNSPPGSRSHASSVAASRGLNISVGDKASRRQSRMVGLPHSPRPRPQQAGPTPSPRSPLTPQGNTLHVPHSPASGPVSPLQTPK